MSTRLIGWLSGVLAFGSCAHADPVKLAPGPFELPDKIGPMRFDGQPHKYDDPRLGASYQYLGGGLSLTVYVYDLGAESIPDGGDTRLACEAYEGAKRDVMHAGYKNVVVKSEQLARLDPAAETPVAREAVFEYTRSDRATLSYLWLTGAAKEFVKLRFSIDDKYRDEASEARRTVLSALGEALKPHLGPVDPEAARKKTTVNVIPDKYPAVMATGFEYLMFLTADGIEHQENLPVCGGELVPDFGHELAAFKSLAHEARPSKFARRLADIDRAGFLDEFVWSYRHREEWGTEPPQGLELAKFETWRARKLRNFTVPNFGSVIYDVPRPLPLEPAGAASP